MRHLREKLHSESGASILIALLLFLVCCMVAASILAAAMSNAGKSRSNRAEQQKYLTLSSAIQLVADEIQEAKYEGRYRLYEWTVRTEVETEVRDAENNVISSHTSTTNEDFFYIEQTAGTYSCGVRPDDTTKGVLTDQIPLGKELDEIFRKQFKGIDYGYEPLPDTAVEAAVPHNLTVTLPNDLAGYSYPDADPDSDPMNAYKVSNAVTVWVQLNHDTQHITLTAWLGTGAAPADKSDTMIAELVARNVPVLDYNRNGRTASDSKPAAGLLPTGTTTVTTTVTTGATTETTTETTTVTSTQDKTEPATQWELNWIKKGGL